ncbi:hypothetical protein [Belliella aquatica]|uniref:Uncharacterized protein n=1 Tax=Belliella aquatica TaxID=1323734 RepID=A0ABQ1N461_9BACT|nr:hypothetical protein [Belliella aquatica]MCH7407420.1 hypothetical protein [Belliella aquatica]GGC53080.1 hypothetical protein GCM10010993_34390 [Belliella aquatica]
MNENFPVENDIQFGISKCEIIKFRKGILGVLNKIKIENRHTPEMLNNIKVVYELLEKLDKAYSEK